jgi:hypothetical protein
MDAPADHVRKCVILLHNLYRRSVRDFRILSDLDPIQMGDTTRPQIKYPKMAYLEVLTASRLRRGRIAHICSVRS